MVLTSGGGVGHIEAVGIGPTIRAWAGPDREKKTGGQRPLKSGRNQFPRLCLSKAREDGFRVEG